MAPYASDPTLMLSEKLASIGYPLGDLMLIALLVRLLLTPGARVITFRLLVAALVVNLVADIVYFTQLLAGTFSPAALSTSGGLTAYVLFGTAALHPSMRRYGQRVESAPPPSNRRLVVMAAAALTAPALIAVRAWRGNYDEIVVIAAAAW